jgi:eukaryotic translation initiation factor 2C
MNPDQGGPYAGIKPGLQQAARAAYQATKTNPQLIIVILPVGLQNCVKNG